MYNPLVVNGITVYTKGNIKNNALVFIHGNSLNASTFRKQFDALNIPMVAFDLPGHGLSARHNEYEEIYNLPGYISALKNVIEQLGIDQFILAGHSLGGHIAIEAAPELQGIKGLFIFGTPPIGIPPEMDKMFLPNPWMGHLFVKDINEQLALDLTKEFVNNNKELAHEMKRMVIDTDGNARLNLGASIGKGQFKNEKEILNQINIPVGILHGEKEKFVNTDYLNQLQIPKLWNNKIHFVSGSGHCPQMENPEYFNSILSDFYKTVF